MPISSNGCWATASSSGCAPRKGVIALGKPYGALRLEAACARALAHDSPYYRTVKTILSTGADRLDTPPAHTPGAYASARFTRDAASLFGLAHPQHDLLH